MKKANVSLAAFEQNSIQFKSRTRGLAAACLLISYCIAFWISVFQYFCISVFQYFCISVFLYFHFRPIAIQFVHKRLLHKSKPIQTSTQAQNFFLLLLRRCDEEKDRPNIYISSSMNTIIVLNLIGQQWLLRRLLIMMTKLTMMMMVTIALCVHNLMYSNGHLETPSAGLNHTLEPRPRPFKITIMKMTVMEMMVTVIMAPV